ncbi:MAG: type II secretion system F family protein [Synechococcales cyanobacterium RM1_1_8]|nr:type II secretion system F family protein [Synechococcales cyanobacterium RM1_1_8]
MASYVAQIRDGQGRIQKQTIEAENARDARALLRDRGLFVQDIKEKKSLDLKDLGKIDINEMLASVTIKDKAVFSRQLAVMVNAGVPIVRALGILSDQSTNPKLKAALVELSNDVQQGSPMSESMRKSPKVFDRLYIAMIQAGEIGGVLDEVLNRLSKLLEDNARLQNQIKSALTYPLVVGGFAVLVFLGLTIFLIPIFAGIFEELDGIELPLLTAVMLQISAFLRNPVTMALLIAIIIGISFATGQYYRTPIGRRNLDGLMLRLPLFGDLIQKNSVARFSRTFGALTRAGVPILTALEIVRDTAGNQVIADSVDKARVEVQSGGMISSALADTKPATFPAMSLQMMMIGEETGELDAMLMKVADFYEDEVEQAVKALTSIIEPVMIVVVGGMVAVILLSMYLPMFKVFDGLG